MPGEEPFRTTKAGSRTPTGHRTASAVSITHVPPRFHGFASPLQPPEMPPKRAEMIARRIVRMIREEGLRPGDPLPVESEMYELFGVGRNTLREALRVLELQGAVIIRRGRGGGPSVGLPDSRHLASTLALLMQFSATPLRSLVDTREHLEPMAAAMCARNGDDRLIEELCQSISAMRANTSDGNAFLVELRRFHELIAAGTRSPLIACFLGALDWIIDGARLSVVCSQASRKRTVLLLEQICDAIRRGDSKHANDAMSEHMREARAFLERKHPKAMSQELTWKTHSH